jgi:hypothetical protein
MPHETPITLKNKIATNHNKESNSIHTFQNIQVSTTGETNLIIINICAQLIHVTKRLQIQIHKVE